jgi:hypothetical protein
MTHYWALTGLQLAVNAVIYILRRRESKVGFKKVKKQYRLVFADPDLEGFVCLCKSLSVDEFTSVAELADAIQASNGKDTAKVREMFDILSDAIIEWNLEEDDSEDIMPHDIDHLRTLEFDFVMKIYLAWMAAMADVPNPLPNGSSDGEISPEHLTTLLASSSPSQQN